MAYLVSDHPDTEAEGRLSDWIARRCAGQWQADLQRCVPHLIALLQQCGDAPIHTIQPQVDLLIRETCEASAADHCPDDPHEISRQIDLILRGLDRIRQQRHGAGRVNIAPVPPIMFG